MSTPWLYNGAEFTDPAEFYGMIYMITHLPSGKKYIGRKFFTKAAVKQKNKKKKKIRVASDWETYYGSNAELLSDVERLGTHEFQREVLRLCKTRGETNYYEAYEIIIRQALLRPDYYNKWVSLKLHRSTLSHLQSSHSNPSDAGSS